MPEPTSILAKRPFSLITILHAVRLDTALRMLSQVYSNETLRKVWATKRANQRVEARSLAF